MSLPVCEDCIEQDEDMDMPMHVPHSTDDKAFWTDLLSCLALDCSVVWARDWLVTYIDIPQKKLLFKKTTADDALA